MAPLWLDVLDQTVRVCVTHGRADLARRLQQKRAQLLAPTLRVVAIGEPRQGKSQLINALVNAPVCPVGGALSTMLPTVVHHAETPVAAIVHTPPSEPPGNRPSAGSRAAPPARTPVPVAELAARIGAGGQPDAGTVHAEVGVPRGLLAAGLVLVDTPGLDGPVPAAPELAGSPVRADVVLLVSDATRELSATELDHLVQLAREHPYLLVVLTKTDLVPGWRAVAESGRKQLADAGVPAPLVPVSAALRLQAAQTNDQAINAESGFPDLLGRLMRFRHTKREVLAPSSAGLLVGRVIEQLAEPLRAGLSTDSDGEPLAKLHDAQRALDELRRCSTRWQNALADEMADLRADIEYDLRDRTRQVLRRADDAFETADPLHTWDDFRTWLDSALTEAAEANFAWLVERCDWIAGRVAGHFAPYGADVAPQWRAEPPQALIDPGTGIDSPAIERFTPTQKLYTGLRGSYLGVLMFGLATTLAGLPLINPISIGAGVLFAGKSIRDESRSLRKRRQATAKLAAQRHVDDFFFRLNKECKDTVRSVQRTLRDHYSSLTEQIHDDIVLSLRTAKQAAEADVAERDQRDRDLREQIRRLAGLYERAQTLATTSAAAELTRLGPGA